MQRAVDRLVRLGLPLAAAVTVLLLLQWPLRDLFGGGAMLANDVAQALFGLYVVLAIRHAGRRGAHLVARAVPDARRAARWHRIGAALCVLPWAIYLLVVSAPSAWRSLLVLERFPETLSPGYFALQASVWLMGLLTLVDAGIDLGRALRARH